MKVNSQKQNPFQKSNPFRPATKMYSHHHETHSSLNLNQLMYRPPIPHSYNINLWNFKDDESRRFNPYLVKPKNEALSPFERSIRLNNSATFRQPPKNKLSSSHIQENPFHRKNLLISREQLERQMEQDINSVNYKYFIKEPDTYRANAWETPIGSQYKGLIDNNGSFMPSHYERQSLGSKKHSNQLNPYEMDENLERRVSFGRKSDAFEHKEEYKDEIVVRGKKFYMEKVYPMGKG